MLQDGIINLLKPAGMTSHDGVQFLRRLTGIKRIGHTGTLDPMAVGVLPLCIGSSARITEYLELDFKSYRCEMQLGMETDTQDIWGEIITDRRDKLNSINEEDIITALTTFKGLISQLPPDYSAVRVNGRRLYEYARKGEKVEVLPREVYINNIMVNHIDLCKGIVTFDVECSKGTYIRTICSDAGRILGCGAAMSCLIRTASGRFTLDDTVTIEELMQGDPEHYLIKTDFPLIHFGTAVVNPERGKWFVNGGHLRMSEVRIEKEPEYQNKESVLPIRKEYRMAYNIYMENRVFLGVAFYNEDYKKLVADKIFFNDRDRI
jgi:tRNA pseudouridine 55 synthase